MVQDSLWFVYLSIGPALVVSHSTVCKDCKHVTLSRLNPESSGVCQSFDLTRFEAGDYDVGVSENRGPCYDTLNSRILIIRTPK